jgi:hypothetical protein
LFPSSTELMMWISRTCPRAPIPMMSLVLEGVACADFLTKFSHLTSRLAVATFQPTNHP